TDPWAMTNLVNSQDPVHQTTLVRLRGTLEKWITESDDQGRVLESAALVAAKGATKPAAGANAAKQKKNKKAN
ncbi:MAG: sulfatase, partial [Opitutaceae bacterium]